MRMFFLLMALAIGIPAKSHATGIVNFGGTGMPDPARRATEGGVPGGYDSQACDADYMNTILTQSWLAGQYDTLLNQTLIVKPDSVFEYTCFHQFLGYTADAIAPLFSESQHWEEFEVDIGTLRGSRMITTGFAREEGSMANALTEAIIPSLSQYLQGNFPHTYLGGTADIDGEAPFIGGASYTCDHMAFVWHIAKCTNFHPPWLPEMGLGNLYEIENFVDFDPRLYPQECNNSQVTQELINISNNEELAFYTIDIPVPEGYDSYQVLRDTSCTSPPIPTGITYDRENPVVENGLVVATERFVFQEYVCPNQGCHYNPDSGACEQ